MRTVEASYIVRVERGPDAGKLFPIGARAILGRQGDIVLTDAGVSRMHAQLELDPAGLRVSTLGAARTAVNDTPLIGATAVRSGSVIQLGETTALRVHVLTCSGPSRAPNLATATVHGGVVEQAAFIDECTIGRDRDRSQLHLDDSQVSRLHAIVRHRSNGFTIEDLGSANGTFVAGSRLTPHIEHDVAGPISIGGHEIDLASTVVLGADVREITIRTIDGNEHAVRVEAGPHSTVADITESLMEAFPGNGDLLLWRAHDGLVPGSEEPWSMLDVQRGERWMLDLDWLGERSDLREAVRGRVGQALVTMSGSYTIPVNRPPRTTTGGTAPRLSPPPLPNEPSWRAQGGLWQLLGAIGGSSAMVVAALLVGGGFIVFAIVGVLAALVTTLATVGAFRSRRRLRLREFDERLARFDRLLACATAQLAADARHSAPRSDELLDWLGRIDERIWERRPHHSDWGQLRVGLGIVPTPIEVAEVDRWQDEAHLSALHRVLGRHALVVDHPVLLPGTAGSVLAVRGRPSEVAALGRSLIVQACTLHDPRSLPVAVVAVDESWSWTEWLPHVQTSTRFGTSTSKSPDAAESLIRRLREEHGPSPDRRGDRGPAQVLIVLCPGALAVPGAEALCRELSGSTCLTLVLSGDDGRLPPDPTSMVVASGGRASVANATVSSTDVESSIEGMTPSQAVRAARLLAPLIDMADRSPATRLPSIMRRSLDGETIDLSDSWSTHGIRPCAIGATDDGNELTIDLRANGPHGVLCGTTGSGKSELIKTIVIALALEHHPETLNFFLIDFKGGSTFYELERLPHVVGVVTDLENDRSLAERAFVSLDAEIVRRKALLERARAIDIIEYERRATGTPLPNLVVVIDEFALLKEQFPDLVPRLDTVAKQGRSLGIHLVLGTQDPRQVVSPDIRSNTNLWISLRVVMREQSIEVLGTPDAANIAPGMSGRGFVRYGASDGVLGFQTYWVTRSASDDRSREVRLLDLNGRPRSGARPHTSSGPTILSSLVELILAEADRRGTRVEPLWLDPLPSHIDGLQLDAGDHQGATTGLQWVCGLFDDPASLSQGPLVIDLAALAHVVAVGAFGSGKTTFMRSAITGLTDHLDPELLHIYVIDGGNGDLGSAVRDVPNVAATVGIDDQERILRVARRMRVEIETRRRRAEISGRWSPAQGSPFIIVFIDEYTAIRELAERWVDGELQDVLALLLQAGPGVGVHVVTSTPQISDMRQATFAMFGGHLLLRLADPTDYRSMGTPILPAKAPPGRGWWHEQSSVLVQVAERSATPTDRSPTPWWPRAIPSMPTEFDLELALDRVETPEGLLIGLGGDEVEPVWFDPRRGRPHLAVIGEARSGRTTALVAIGVASSRIDPARALHWLGSIPSTWPTGASASVTDLADAADLFRDLEGPALLLLDDAERISDPSACAALTGLVRTGLNRDIWIVAAGRPSEFLRSYEDWVRSLLALQTGLLLCPTPDVEIALELRPSRTRPPQLPGRALLAVVGQAIPVQIGLTHPLDDSGRPLPHFQQTFRRG